MSADSRSSRRDHVASKGAMSPTTVQRHPFTRTPSTEPPRFHLPRDAHPHTSSADGTLPVHLGPDGPNDYDRLSLDTPVNALPSSSTSSAAVAGPSSPCKYWPEPSASHSYSASSYSANGHLDADSYALDDRSGPQFRTARSRTTGYASSTDGDLTPIPSGSSPIPANVARTPLVGVNLTDQQIADMTESDVSEYDDSAKLRRARRGSAANPSAASMFSTITKSFRGEPFWSKSGTSYTPLTGTTRSRSLKKSKWNRTSKTDKALFSTTSSAPSKDRGRSRRTAPIWLQPFSMLASFFTKIFRTAFGPIHPVTIILALVLIASFVVTVTKLIIYILNPDKEQLPWRFYCQKQPPFPHAYADALAPVDVFVGVFSIDSSYERRHLIRSTYATHELPLDPHTGMPTSNVQVKFIIGKPRRAHARRVALELETFNDIVVLDMEENMNRGKTHAFFQWAAENATVPFLRPVDQKQQFGASLDELAQHGNGHGQTREVLGGSTEQAQRYQVLWKKADYVVKADDDAYLRLQELERHLRVAPRQMTYWGYLIRNWFMGGECYALSSDLVQYVAHSESVLHHVNGKEDKKVAQWMSLHPNRSDIHWVEERCWIYDHPKAGTAYSHGFLFPDYVEKIKLEGRRGLTDQEIARRGGEHRAKSYSTVSRWHLPYVEPRSDLTIEEEVEALVEGGGRWAGTWVRGEEGNDTQIWVPWQQIVFEANDERLRPPMLDTMAGHPTLAEEVGIDPASGLTVRHINALHPNPLDPMAASMDGDVQPSRRRKRDIPFLAHLPSVPGFDFGAGGVSRGAAEERKRSFASSAMQPRMIPLPTHKDGNGEAEELRNRRYLGRPFGGTVVVHYLKKSEWFYETALAFSGRGRFWPDGAGGTGSEWRMYGSPLVRHEDGYVSVGRSQPRPDMEMAYMQQARIQAQANAAQAQALAARMGSFTKSKMSNAPPSSPPPSTQEQQEGQQQQQQSPGST
ncbi:glycosyltransferase [Pseudozyma hubeiensis SY62]|uniref:Glycosyltransferase n=1 Tax=Pseudozyma hubeiensis (strain SY62) TaxID=1305764 RepID=R9NX17_PSEHS|nr:glycosyltransferase [Pseudozyma hubeiensis SY62]GAC93114.1 glycosyltransferase [Pseudozyma hubeiensis SY62]